MFLIEHFSFEGSEKLGIEKQNVLKVVLEEDGSEVDDEYFSFIPKNVVLQLLTVDERLESPEGMNLVNTREPILLKIAMSMSVSLSVCPSV